MDAKTAETLESLSTWIKIGVVAMPLTGLLIAGALIKAAPPAEVPEHTHDQPAQVSFESVQAQRLELVDAQGKVVVSLQAAPAGLKKQGLAVVDATGRPRAVIETAPDATNLIMLDSALKTRVSLGATEKEAARLALFDSKQARAVLHVDESKGRAGLVITDGAATPRVGLSVDDRTGESFKLINAKKQVTHSVPPVPASGQ